MTTAIAILVGMGDYISCPKLDCCKDDVDAIGALIEATRRFDVSAKIIDEDAVDLKAKIRKCLEEAGPLSEVFFYFSGHGSQLGGEFYFCARDFNTKTPNQTAMAVDELHDLLRGSEAGTVVQVIDACHSGQNLIKAEHSALSKEPIGFKHFIRFASCLDDQETFAGDPISEYTAAFIDAALRATSGPVYYQDMAASIRDHYLNNISQAPHYVAQQTGREMLVSDASLLNSLRSKYGTKPHPIAGEESPSAAPAAVAPLEVLNSLEETFTDQSIAQSVVDRFCGELISAAKSDDSLTEYFDVEHHRSDDYYDVPDEERIVAVLERQPRYDNLVTAKSTYHPPQTMPALSAMDYIRPRYTEGHYSYYLHLNCELKGVFLRIRLSPKFRSLKELSLNIVCAPSLDRLYIFSGVSRHTLTDWAEYSKSQAQVPWKWVSTAWRESTAEVARRCVTDLIKEGLDHVRDVVGRAEAGRS